MQLKCPICKTPLKQDKSNIKKPTPAQDNHFPFCSMRCKFIDLGAWLDQRYTIHAQNDGDRNQTDLDLDPNCHN